MFFKRAKKSDDAASAVVVPTTAAPAATDKAVAHLPLDADKLRRVTNAGKLGFKTTADVVRSGAEPFDARRVWDALRAALASGAGKTRPNILIAAPRDSAAQRAVATHLATLAQATDTSAPDWILVRADASSSPWSMIPVPTGQGKRLVAGVDAVVARLRSTLPYLLNGEDLALRRATIEDGFAAVRDDAFARLRAMAQTQNVAVVTTPMGFAVAPMHEGKVVKPEVLARLPGAMRDEVRRKVEAVEAELQTLLSDVPTEASSQVAELSELISDYIRPAVATGFEGLVKEFSGAAPAMAFLSATQDDIVRLACRDGAAASLPDYCGRVLDGPGKSLVSLEPPADADAISKALLRAGKGVVLIDAAHLGHAPSAWATLQACLETRIVALSDVPGQGFPIASSVVVIADPLVVDRLGDGAAGLFHVHTGFASDAARSEETEGALARMIATAADDRGLLPLDAAAVGYLIAETAHATGRPDRLSGDLDLPLAIASDAGRLASLANRATITEADIQSAMIERRPTPVQPLFAPASAGMAGRVLAIGLAAEPVEVWATVRAGKGTAADIVRSAPSGSSEIAGSATAMLWSIIAGRFAASGPLSLAAAIIHDPPIAAAACVRTSAAEVYALFSALADAPIANTFATAGWVSPAGALLPIPGINAAIESAFDHAGGRDAARPLSIVIPRANEAGLMLRADVVEAARKGKLQILTAADIDEGLSILTGMKAGTIGDAPGEASLNRRIEDRLISFARQVAAGEVAQSPQAARASVRAAGAP